MRQIGSADRSLYFYECACRPLDDEYARQLATGEMDPISKRPIFDLNPHAFSLSDAPHVPSAFKPSQSISSSTTKKSSQKAVVPVRGAGSILNYFSLRPVPNVANGSGSGSGKVVVKMIDSVAPKRRTSKIEDEEDKKREVREVQSKFFGGGGKGKEVEVINLVNDLEGLESGVEAVADEGVDDDEFPDDPDLFTCAEQLEHPDAAFDSDDDNNADDWAALRAAELETANVDVDLELALDIDIEMHDDTAARASSCSSFAHVSSPLDDSASPLPHKRARLVGPTNSSSSLSPPPSFLPMLAADSDDLDAKALKTEDSSDISSPSDSFARKRMLGDDGDEGVLISSPKEGGIKEEVGKEDSPTPAGFAALERDRAGGSERRNDGIKIKEEHAGVVVIKKEKDVVGHVPTRSYKGKGKDTNVSSDPIDVSSAPATPDSDEDGLDEEDNATPRPKPISAYSGAKGKGRASAVVSKLPASSWKSSTPVGRRQTGQSKSARKARDKGETKVEQNDPTEREGALASVAASWRAKFMLPSAVKNKVFPCPVLYRERLLTRFLHRRHPTPRRPRGTPAPDACSLHQVPLPPRACPRSTSRRGPSMRAAARLAHSQSTSRTASSPRPTRGPSLACLSRPRKGTARVRPFAWYPIHPRTKRGRSARQEEQNGVPSASS